MNRAELVRAIAACDALGEELRRTLRADAEAEYIEQGTAPTWRVPGVTVSTAVTRDRVDVVDEHALIEYVADRCPTEVVTVRQVRPAFLRALIADVSARGVDPPCDVDGRVVPGLVWRRGGEFRSVSVRPSAELADELTRAAREIAAGRRPLSLPGGEPDEA